MKLVCMLTAISTPSHTMNGPTSATLCVAPLPTTAIPNDLAIATASGAFLKMASAAGLMSGTIMNASSKKSRKNASRNTARLTRMRNPYIPPGSDTSRCSTHLCPSTP